MSLSFLAPSRTVLLIGDDGLSIYKVSSNSAKLVDVVSWQADDFEPRSVKLIRNECGNKPVLLVNDMTDQHFKGGQRMPKVSIMDKQSVLERKLQVAFPNYPIRGALPIKQSKRELREAVDTSATDGGSVRGHGGLYLFAGIPMSEPIVKTMNVARRSMVSIAGLVLLPVEAADMVAALSQKLSGKGRNPSRWTIFIGQHRGGALRQVITRDGQLAMTRMTPVSDSRISPAKWSAEVAQEFKATIGYLSRFGYAPDDGTDVIVVAAPEDGDTLKSLIDIPCNYTSFTVNEAARLLGMGLGLQDDQRFADPLHAAWTGRKARFTLPMQAQELSNVLRPRQYAAMVMLLLGLSAAYLGWEMIGEIQKMSSMRGELAVKQNALIVAKGEEDIENKKMMALGFDVKMIKASINSFEKSKKEALAAMPTLKKIGQSLGGELRLTTLIVEIVDHKEGSTGGAMSYQASPPENQNAAGGTKEAPIHDMLATLTLNFPPTIEPGVGVKEVNDFHSRLQQAFPGYNVSISKQVADLAYTANTSGKIGVIGEGGQPTQDYVAELQIRGPLQ